jgi:hypothetical protein
MQKFCNEFYSNTKLNKELHADCAVCIRAKQTVRKRIGSQKAVEKVTKEKVDVMPGSMVALDIMQMPKSASGKRYIAVFADIGTRFTIMCPLARKDSESFSSRSFLKREEWTEMPRRER